MLSHSHFDGDQHVLRLAVSALRRSGDSRQFRASALRSELPMRRPLSIMRAQPQEGWIELLYKVTGAGTRALSRGTADSTLSVLGPIGQGFNPHPERPRVLAIGGGVGIPPMIFLAERLAQDQATAWKPLVLMGSELPFPFRVRPSTILVPGMPDAVIGGMPLLDDLGVPSRLATHAGFPGCYDGYVTDLARAWLQRSLRRAAGGD